MRVEVQEAIDYLQKPSPSFVDIDVTVDSQGSGNVRVTSRHTDSLGRRIDEFGITWPNPTGVNTEYGWGISVLHDIKDHRFYGLGISYLTEFQTIVQTYYGRSVALTDDGSPADDEWEDVILAAIEDELFGPRGPRVYGPDNTGLLDAFAPNAVTEERNEARWHMAHICFDLMLPPIREMYRRNPLIRRLQAPTTLQPELLHAYLPSVVWRDPLRLVLDIRENIGLKVSARAYVNANLHRMSEGIASAIAQYSQEHHLIERFGPIFDTTDYVLRF